MADGTNPTIYLKDYRPTPYAILDVDMRFELAANKVQVFTVLVVEKRAQTDRGAALVLDGEELTLVGAKIDGAALAPEQYDATDDGLRIHNPPSERFELETHVEIAPEQNTQLMGLYRSSGNWCTQCEAEGFRRITYMYDRPDVLATYRVRIEADKSDAPVLLSNGNLVEQGEMADGRHFAVWEDPFPKPSYLFAIVAGDLGVIRDRFTTASGRDVDLAIYCEHGKEDRCAFAMDSLKRSMVWDEQHYGREYDLDVFNIVAVSDFNFGAMENKGLNIFNDKAILAAPETATDADFARIEGIVAHEYFHNWTGNRITCRDWFQLCLKEGLTVYRDQEFSADERSRAVKRIQDVRDLRASQFPEDDGPLAHPPRPDSFTEINNFYTATVYSKGAEVVRMLATLLGAEDFRKGTDLYFERHDGQATTIESWLKVFEDAAGRDLSQFSRWYTQAGTPEVTAERHWNEENRTYHLRLRQTTAATPGQPDKLNLVIPIEFGLIGPNGQDLKWTAVRGGTVEGSNIVFDQAEIELIFEGIASRPVPSLLRGFSAPVKLNSNMSTADQLFLARHDSDPLNRWQALQDTALEILVKAARSEDAVQSSELLALSNALTETVQNAELDNAFKALALALPGEVAIARALVTNIDPARIHDVRGELQRALGDAMSDTLKAVYDGLVTEATFSQDTNQVHDRALKNQCLALLVASGQPEMAALAATQFGEADNMTDRIGALGASVANWNEQTPAMLETFGQQAEGDWLVKDKWLTLNAMRPDARALERVRELLSAPDFPGTNPNRLRALVGGFAMGNLAQFTRLDGAGFAFLADFCRDFDNRSPQVAARMLTAFRSWRNWEPKRRELAEAHLRELAESPELSSDLSDILNRILAV